MAQDAPDRAAEALFHVGFTRYVRGDRPVPWPPGRRVWPAVRPAPALQAQLLYWIAKAAPSGSARAQDALNQAAAAAPETYYGLRAQEQLSGTLSVASSTPPTSTAWLAPSASEVQERDAWLAGLKTTPERVAQQIDALPALQRADACSTWDCAPKPAGKSTAWPSSTARQRTWPT